MALARYLYVKVEMDELDEIYAYGRATMQHYGRWMADNERPALSCPDELEYVTEAWAVQDVRKANALRLCARFEDDMRWIDKMRRKADEIAAAAWRDLYTFEDRYNARAISVLMTEGLRDAWHQIILLPALLRPHAGPATLGHGNRLLLKATESNAD